MHCPCQPSPGKYGEPLPAGVRSIGNIMPEILNQYGLSLDELDECQPQPPATAFVSITPSSHSVLEPMAAISSWERHAFVNAAIVR